MDLLQTVREISVSKFPVGKVVTLQMYLPSSAGLVPISVRAESAIGSLFSNRTRPVYPVFSKREKRAI